MESKVVPSKNKQDVPQQSELLLRDVPFSKVSPIVRLVHELPPQQSRFVYEYVVDKNGTKAAERAGFSVKTAAQQASRLLRNVKVKAAIDGLLGLLNQECQITAERVLKELSFVALSDVKDAFDDEGNLRPLRDMPEGIRRAISSVESDELFEGMGKDREKVGVTKKLRLWDKNTSLIALAKHFKLLTDSVELSGKDGNSIQVNVINYANAHTPA